MDFLPNENSACSAAFDNQNSSNNPSVLKADLQKLKVKRQKLEEKISNHDFLKSEVKNLMIQLEHFEQSIKDAKQNQEKFYDEITKDLANTSIMSEQLNAIQNSVIKLENENQELECFLHSQTSLETKIINETEQLECIYKKSKEYNDELNKKQALNRKRVELEDAIASKSSELARCLGDLAIAESDVQTESKRLVGLQRRNAECDQTLRRLAVEQADREAERAAFEADAVHRSAQAARSAEAVAGELASARAALAGHTAERRRAAEVLCELQAASEAEAHRWRAAIRDLACESGRLMDRLVDASACAAAAVADRVRLADCARAHFERLAELTAQTDRLEQRAGHERVVHATRRAMYDGDAALLEHEVAVKRVAAAAALCEIDDAMRYNKISCGPPPSLRRDRPTGGTTPLNGCAADAAVVQCIDRLICRTAR